ncbi:MAG: cell division protein ZapA [Bacteroidetes bacterium]|nr:cell division protein ZapA [Bacteroidota bacterium]MDA1335658.1 cell division protein ZapA [Bacteroidota bacterium]
METIRLNIAGREYPLRVPAGESAKLEAAAAAINAQYAAFQKQFNIDDARDLLAMTALNLLSTAPPSTPASASTSTPAIAPETLNRIEPLIQRIQEELEI